MTEDKATKSAKYQYPFKIAIFKIINLPQNTPKGGIPAKESTLILKQKAIKGFLTKSPFKLS